MTTRPQTLALFVVLALATACGSVNYTESSGSGQAQRAGSRGSDGYPVGMTNCGRRLTVESRPKRVVSLYPGQTELLVELGLGDRIVAQAQDAVSEPDPDLAEEVAAIPSLDPDSPPAKEVLIAEEPDFIYSGTEFEFNTEMGFAGTKDLQAVGATPYVAKAGCLAGRSDGTVEDMFTDLENLGRIFGVEQQAAELAKKARAELDDVSDQVNGKRVRTALVYSDAGKLTAIAAAVDADMLRLGGGENIFTRNDSRFSDFFAAEVNPEVVSERDPEAFVFAVQDKAHQRQTISYLRRTFPQTPAVRENRLVPVRNTVFAPGTLASIEGVRTIADGLHPRR
ncbi:ABC transporter substrate-binding protein [Actinopolymorpha sp. B17G11]|uniref:ABC transporter substrate-binding protein n=1 Tax=Actinopolymorpha sp. B17G11 TaxID=3160861 RepID=UPI0032E3D145